MIWCRWQVARVALACVLSAICGSPLADTSVQIPAQRIVTLAPHLTEMVYATGAGDRLVGVVEFSDYPAAARALPRVGDAFRLDEEALAALQPDLILAWASGNPVAMLERLKQLGYRIVALESGSLDSVADQLELIGQLAGSEPVARAAARRYRLRLDDLRKHWAAVDRVSVFYQVSVRPLLTVTRSHVIGQALELCGGKNVFATLPGQVPPVSVEAVLDAAPQAIVTGGFGSGPEPSLEPWLRWRHLPAVVHHNLFVVPADLLSRPGPRLVDGVEAVCNALEQARDRLRLDADATAG